MRPLFSFLLSALVLLTTLSAAWAKVEVGRAGRSPETVEDVYLREGTAFLPLGEVLDALQLQGRWDSVRHRYLIETSLGQASLFPGGHYLAVGDRFLPLSRTPRFIDGKLRVSEEFLTGPLAELVGFRIYYRNLTPGDSANSREATSQDRLFAFLLHQKGVAESGPLLRGVALDPGHGGQDVGTLGDGVREKDIALDLAEDLEKQIKMRLGIPVYLSRNADYGVSARERRQTVSRAGVDALLQIHAQAAFDPRPAGVRLFVRPFEESRGTAIPAGEGRSMALARELAAALRAAEIPVTGVRTAPLKPLGRGDLPTVLVEAGFLSHPEDRQRLTDPGRRRALAQALYQGLKAFGQQTKESTP